MALPINVQRLASLAEPPFNLPSSSFRYNSVAIESDQYVCVKDVAADGSNQVVVIDLHHDNAITRRPTKKAEAALMHTKDNIIVLKGNNENAAGHFIQIFNLDTKTRLLEHHFSEDITFWKWVSHSILAVVTTASIWHCPLEVGKTPEKIFDRDGKLSDSNVQIINYTVDANIKWCLLAGISTQDKKVIDGHLQLYSVERQQQQFLDGHTGCFGSLVVDESKPPIAVFSFTERKDGLFKIHVLDIYSPRGDGQPPPLKITTDLAFPPEAPMDFPIFEYLSPKHGVIYLVSRGGYVIVVDALTGTVIFRHNVSKDAVFVACGDSQRGGLIFANRKGEVLSATLNEQAVIPYIKQNLRQLPNCNEIAISLVRRYGYPGADDVLLQLYNAAFARADYKSAVRIAATMKSGGLRTPQTINQLKSVPAQPGQTSPILLYFSTLLEQGTLNSVESLELVRPVVAQGRKELIAKWLSEDKLECSEALGDTVKPLDVQLALRIYEKVGSGTKVLQAYVEQGQYEKIIAYAKKANLQTDYSVYLRNMVNVHPEGAVNFAKELLAQVPALIDIKQVIDVFVQQNRLQEITSILLEYLKGNKPEEGHLQTRLLELNLTHATPVAEAIFQMELFTHYDRAQVAKLCEKAGLYQRALEHYTEYSDIKRILSIQSSSGSGQMNTDWMVTYFGKLPADTCLECLTDMLRANRQNIQVVVQVAIKHHESIGTKRLIDMFETFQSWEGIFYFVGSIQAFCTDPDVHFKYIEAASKLNHLQEVERVCRESQHFDPIRVKEFLKQAKLPDPRPLIYVCDRYGYVTELAEYLYRNSLMKYIEVYVVKVNPLQAPTVVGTLIDLDCSEDFIKNLLQSVRGACPVKELVEEVEKRNRLRLLLPWLESRVSEGNQEPYLHNALAMIYIDTNRDPENFLKTNAFYDSKVVGKYCEERDPHLAYTAYKKNWGQCDLELVQLTNKNGLFRLQARYLVERQSPELWLHVLDPSNEWRQHVVDQVVASALPESTNAEEVSAAVRAFIAANLPNELMELLEKIVLHNSDFSQNRSLQNLLILTAIKSDPSRVTDYISRLEHYDGPEIAQVALGDDYKMYEEAVLIYQKSGMDDNAIDVIISKIGSLERAAEFATRCDKPSAWGRLGTAQLQKGQIREAVESFLKAEDPSCYQEVIEKAEEQESYHELIQYLLMARQTMSVKDSAVDSELVFALAKCNRLNEMEEFVSGSNTANVQLVADRLAEASQYTAAKVLYASVPNYSKLATCHLKLGEYAQAVDVAKRATSPKTWKEVNMACVAAGEFRSAHIAGLAVLRHPDHLEELILNYERLGHFEELMALLEAGVNSERAPVALHSELGIVYAKYKPAKLAEFIRSSNVTSGRLNIPKLIRACERHLLWKEAVFLHTVYKEYDQAISVMIQHQSAWNHQEMLTTIQKVANSELYYRALTFYLEVSPMEINSLLIAVASKVDHSRVVFQMRKVEQLPLIQQYLEHVQQQQLDIAAVNTALNELYLESEDVEALRRSVTENPNFDQLALAKKLENHELLEMRRLACQLYRCNRKFAEAVELSKKDDNFHDAMEAARISGSTEVAEDLLKYFVIERKDKECFAACLCICYELLRPDVVVELAWRAGLIDQIMPYMIQTFREITTRLDALEKKVGENTSDKIKSAPNDYVPDYIMPCPILPGMGNLALMPPPGLATSASATPSTTLPARHSPAPFPSRGFSQDSNFSHPVYPSSSPSPAVFM